MKGEEVYAQALLEIQECRMQPALWARAQVTAQGDGNAAISHYILYRVQQGAGNGPDTQVILHGCVHNPRHGTQRVAREAANCGEVVETRSASFLRQPGRVAQVPVWANPPGHDADTEAEEPWRQIAPHHSMPRRHSRAGMEMAWRRCVARLADLSIICTGLLALLVMMTPEQNALPALLARLLGVQLQGGNPDSLFVWCVNGSLLLALLPVALCIDAAIHAVFGGTPGKVLGGVEVQTRHGPLTARAYFLRNCQVWLNGLGLGVLPIATGALVWQFMRVVHGCATSYDHAESLSVRLTPVSGLRMAAAYLLLGSGVLGCAGLGGLMFDIW